MSEHIINQENTITKLDLKDTIQQAFKLCKENYKLFILISSLLSLNSIIQFILIEVLFKSDGLLGTAGGVLNFPLMMVGIYFSVMLNISLITSIYNRYHNETCTFKDAFQNSKSIFWTYFGVHLALGIISMIPVSIISRGLNYSGVFILKGVLVGFGSLLTLYISTVFMFTPIATVIEDKGEHYFKRSSYLMKGNFIKLIGLAFIMKGMFSLPSYYLRLIKYKDVVMPTDIRLVQILVKNGFQIFWMPLSISVLVIAYLTLRNEDLHIKDV